MPSGRSKRLWTSELSWQAMEGCMCYDRNTERALLLKKL